MFILSQCLVVVATLLDLISFQFKSRQLILLCLFSSVLLTAAHFFVLGNTSAGLLMLIAAVRYFYCAFYRSHWVMLGFMIICCIGVYLTANSWVSVVALVATLLQTYASFSKSDLRLRQLMIVGTSFWIAHNLLVGSPMAVFMESIFLTSNLGGLYRFYIRRVT